MECVRHVIIPNQQVVKLIAMLIIAQQILIVLRILALMLSVHLVIMGLHQAQVCIVIKLLALIIMTVKVILALMECALLVIIMLPHNTVVAMLVQLIQIV